MPTPLTDKKGPLQAASYQQKTVLGALSDYFIDEEIALWRGYFEIIGIHGDWFLTPQLASQIVQNIQQDIGNVTGFEELLGRVNLAFGFKPIVKLPEKSSILVRHLLLLIERACAKKVSRDPSFPPVLVTTSLRSPNADLTRIDEAKIYTILKGLGVLEENKVNKLRLLELYLDRERKRKEGEDISSHPATVLDEVYKNAKLHGVIADAVSSRIAANMADTAIFKADPERLEQMAQKIGEDFAEEVCKNELDIPPQFTEDRTKIAVETAIMSAVGIRRVEDYRNFGIWEDVVDKVIEEKKKSRGFVSRGEEVKDTLDVLSGIESLPAVIVWEGVKAKAGVSDVMNEISKKGGLETVVKNPELTSSLVRKYGRQKVEQAISLMKENIFGRSGEEIERAIGQLGGSASVLSKIPLRESNLSEKIIGRVKEFYGERPTVSGGKIFPAIGKVGAGALLPGISAGIVGASLPRESWKEALRGIEVSPLAFRRDELANVSFPTKYGKVETPFSVRPFNERGKIAEILKVGIAPDRIGEVVSELGRNYKRLLKLPEVSDKELTSALGIKKSTTLPKISESIKTLPGATLAQLLNVFGRGKPPLEKFADSAILGPLTRRLVSSSLSGRQPLEQVYMAQALMSAFNRRRLEEFKRYQRLKAAQNRAIATAAAARNVGRSLLNGSTAAAAGGPFGTVPSGILYVGGKVVSFLSGLGEIALRRAHMAYVDRLEASERALKILSKGDEALNQFFSIPQHTVILNSLSVINLKWRIWQPNYNEINDLLNDLRKLRDNAHYRRLARVTEDLVEAAIQEIERMKRTIDPELKVALAEAAIHEKYGELSKRLAVTFYKVTNVISLLLSPISLWRAAEGNVIQLGKALFNTAKNLSSLLGAKGLTKVFGALGKGTELLGNAVVIVDSPIEFTKNFAKEWVKGKIVKGFFGVLWKGLLRPLFLKGVQWAFTHGLISAELAGFLGLKSAVTAAATAMATSTAATAGATAVGTAGVIGGGAAVEAGAVGVGAAVGGGAAFPPALLAILIVIVICVICVVCMVLCISISGGVTSSGGRGTPGVAIPYEEQHFIVRKDEKNIKFSFADEVDPTMAHLVTAVEYPISIIYDGQGKDSFKIESITDTFSGFSDNFEPGRVISYEIPSGSSKPFNLYVPTNLSDPRVVPVLGVPSDNFPSNQQLSIEFHLKATFSDTLDKFLKKESDGSMKLCNKVSISVNIGGSARNFSDEVCVYPSGVAERKEVCPFKTSSGNIGCTQCPYCCGGSHEGSNAVDVVEPSGGVYGLEVVSPVDGVIKRVEENMLCKNAPPHHGDYVVIESGGIVYEFAHLKIDPNQIYVGKNIKAGEHIGYWDTTLEKGPCWTGSHIHAGIRGLPSGEYADDVFRDRFKCNLGRCVCPTGSCYVCTQK